MIFHFAGTALALIIERLVGYPKPLYQKIGHPVEWIGRLIAKLEADLNRGDSRRLKGIAACVLLLVMVVIPSLFISSLLVHIKFGWIVEALLATTFIAQHSMAEHVSAVAKGLNVSLHEGRTAVAKIVGRDPTSLDESAISRAALESLAENTSDGIVAPALWFALLGLPGIVMYKAINTADSMVGHKSERYRDFGWAAARLDDLVNLPASRLSGLLFAAAAAWNDRQRGIDALRAMWRDASKHQSPNAGWPESALAASLAVKFGGPRSYDGVLVDLPWLGDGREVLTRDDISKGLRLYATAMTMLFAASLACALLF